MKRANVAACITAVIMSLAVLSACGQKSDPPVSEAASETESEGKTGSGDLEEDTKEETAEAATVKETESQAEEKIITGRVDGIERTVVTISGQDDLEYQIDLKEAKTENSLEVSEGDEIQVTFLDDGSTVKRALSYVMISSTALEGDRDPVIAGVIIQADGHFVTIEAASQNQYTFSTQIAQLVTGETGLAAGNHVEITYLDSLEKGTALRVITEEASGDVEATYNVMAGQLVSVSDAALEIQADDGSRFTFTVGDSIDVTELEAGQELEVTYEGSLTRQNAVAEDVEER